MGEEDYGINNVVGGVVAMFTFLTNTLSSASQRFFAFELGRNNLTRLNQYFNATLVCYIVLSVLILGISETLGLWFVKEKLTIPDCRKSAALFIFQFAVFTFIVKLYVVSYLSVIMAREQMKIYAIVSVLEATMQLVSAFVIQSVELDRLKLYSVLLFLSSLLPSICYVFYSVKKFPETKLNMNFSRKMLTELVSYCGWNLVGSLAGVFRSQGINILLNIFFTPVVNAARAVAFQINNAINQLSTCFFNAVKPQITKKYAVGDSQNMMLLVYKSSCLSFFLLWFFSLPLLLEIPFVLSVWLVDVPEYTILFVRLVIINAIVDGLAHPLMSAIQATGNIKKYQMITGGLLLLNLPVSYFFLKLGFAPQVTMIVSIIVSIIAQYVRIVFMNKQLNMNVIDYIRNVLAKILIMSILTSTMSSVLHSIIVDEKFRFWVILLFSSVLNILVFCSFVIEKEDRIVIIKYLKKTKNENL
ncbi:MAG: lipopolysaccharide biosynthesis protein [Bacteroidales bacterium]|nr:lipopolysaccharide biosynthesis protein [Bacteroidales bacterium]